MVIVLAKSKGHVQRSSPYAVAEVWRCAVGLLQQLDDMFKHIVGHLLKCSNLIRGALKTHYQQCSGKFSEYCLNKKRSRVWERQIQSTMMNSILLSVIVETG